VPVTARLSKRFYEVFGEQIATELVDWFNAVDATYRSDLHELNELNFARFDAKLEQRLTELDAKWGGRAAALDAKLEQRLADLDAKWERRLAEWDVKWAGGWSALDAKLDQRVAELRTSLADLKSELLRWMFAFWVTTGLALAGLFFRK
jgi:hypothetical protein